MNETHDDSALAVNEVRYGRKPELTLEMLTPKARARFEAKVDRSGGPMACWRWTSSTTSPGPYGTFSVASKTYKAHRVAYVLYVGPIPRGLDVLHSCDVPPCTNPAHLWIGTPLDNARDKESKGRGNRGCGDAHWSRKHPERYSRGDDHPYRKHPELVLRGSANGNAVLTEDAVRRIRQLHAEGSKRSALAIQFGVSRGLINHVVTRRAWKHVL